MGVKEFEAALLIDKHNLDTEILSQADLFYRVAQRYAEAVSIRDEMHEVLKETDAEVNLAIRHENSGTKITEAQINATVLKHKFHMEAFGNWLTAKEEADKAGNLKEAFIQRSYMLRDLAQLYIAGYFSEKSVSADNETSKDAVYQKHKSRLAERRRDKE